MLKLKGITKTYVTGEEKVEALKGINVEFRKSEFVSIMIAIITYISVLERTKEIGILRAMGTSKKDVSKIFNAETFIEGSIAGLLGIGVTLLLNIPINLIVKNLTSIETISELPLIYAIILIFISIILTVIAGLIPSKLAAKKDPAEVLRTE